MNWKEFITDGKTVTSLITVIVSVAALFGLQLSEVALTDVWEQVVQLLAALGIVGGGSTAAYVAWKKRAE